MRKWLVENLSGDGNFAGKRSVKRERKGEDTSRGERYSWKKERGACLQELIFIAREREGRGPPRFFCKKGDR
jgi:hypothetical protein